MTLELELFKEYRTAQQRLEGCIMARRSVEKWLEAHRRLLKEISDDDHLDRILELLNEIEREEADEMNPISIVISIVIDGVKYVGFDGAKKPLQNIYVKQQKPLTS